MYGRIIAWVAVAAFAVTLVAAGLGHAGEERQRLHLLVATVALLASVFCQVFMLIYDRGLRRALARAGAGADEAARQGRGFGLGLGLTILLALLAAGLAGAAHLSYAPVWLHTGAGWAMVAAQLGSLLWVRSRIGRLEAVTLEAVRLESNAAGRC